MGRRKTGQREKAVSPAGGASPKAEGWSFALDDELLTECWSEPAEIDATPVSAAEPAAADFVMQPLRLPAATRNVAAAGAPVPANPAVIAQVEILAAPPASAPRAAQPRPQTVQVVASGTVQSFVARPAPRPFGATPLRAAAQPAFERASGQWTGRAPTGAFGIFESDTMVFKGDAETG